MPVSVGDSDAVPDKGETCDPEKFSHAWDCKKNRFREQVSARISRVIGNGATWALFIVYVIALSPACTQKEENTIAVSLAEPKSHQNMEVAKSHGAQSSVSTTPSLRHINDWTYQLQGADGELLLEPIASSAFDLAVIDYSSHGDEEHEFASAEVARLKNGAGGRKVVLAYMSIGEAEVGRFYFRNGWVAPSPVSNPDGPFTLTDAAPSWLVEPNPSFPDNFKVRYWQKEWQQIVVYNSGKHPLIGDAKSYLDRIIDAGFDGVYLDIIDAFEFFGPQEIGGNNENRLAATAMIDFVIAIAEHARVVRGIKGFLVVPQNGATIIHAEAFPEDSRALDNASSAQEEANRQKTRYFEVINGIGAEDTFYFGDNDEDNPLDPQTFVIEHLDIFHEAGFPVLAVDYLTNPVNIDDFYTRARQKGYVPYATIRNLDRVVVNPTQQLD